MNEPHVCKLSVELVNMSPVMDALELDDAIFLEWLHSKERYWGRMLRFSPLMPRVM